MSSTPFHRIGPYEIEKEIGRGGMALVFLARDTRPGGQIVALKAVREGPDADMRETADAEERGARLQQTLLAGSTYVPKVYDIGRASGYVYVAMEYLDGEDLADLIRRGPIGPSRAVAIAIQLCEFLEEVDRLESSVAGDSPLTLLHNDLKPTNVRLTAGDRVKVLDFGAAKALSMSRGATRNDFYSTPYLSPECLNSGERDRQADAWALGVILYEMVAGRRPFRDDNTRRLEKRILSRRPPEPIADCPQALQGVIAKLLAPYPQDRYDSAAAIRQDLQAFASGAPTAAQKDGWPDKAMDEPATRRIRSRADVEPPTRPVLGPGSRPTAAAFSGAPPAASNVRPAAAKAFRRLRRLLAAALVIVILAAIANEGLIAVQANRVAATVPMQEFDGLTTVWAAHQAFSRRSVLLGAGVRQLEQTLRRQTQILADRVIGNYRSAMPTVRSAHWAAAADALRRAAATAPNDPSLRATLRYCEGHLHRIDGEAQKLKRQTAQAQRHFADAVAAYREAAALRSDWPDPFLGLARTFIYGLEDLDRGADAIKQAEKLGYVLGARETAQLADGYRARGGALERAAATLVGMPQEREFLTRSRDAYRQALDLYDTIVGFGDVPTQIRITQRRIDVIDRKLGELETRSFERQHLPGEAMSALEWLRRITNN
jgi:serine/threonine-protein kinase